MKPGEEKKFVEDLVTEYHSRYPEWRFEAAMTVVAPEGGSVIIIPDEASRVTIHTGEQSYIPVKQEVTNQSLLGVLWLSATYAPSEAVWKAQIHLTHLMILGDPSDCTLIRKTMADAGVREGLNASRPCLQRTLEAVRREVRAIPGIQGLDWTLERLSATSGTDAVRLWVRVSSNR